MEGRCGSLTQAPAKEPPIRMAATGMAPRLASTPPEAPCQPLQSQKAPFSFEMNRLSIELPFTFLCFYRSPFAHIWSPNAPLLGCRTHPWMLNKESGSCFGQALLLLLYAIYRNYITKSKFGIYPTRFGTVFLKLVCDKS